MPWHPWRLEDGELVTDIVFDMLKIEQTRVVIVLSWEKRIREVCGVYVGKGAEGRVVHSIMGMQTV